MTRRLLFWILAGALLLAAPAAYGAVFSVSESDAPLRTREVVDDDLYMAGNTVLVEHDVREDLMAAGNTVEVDSSIAHGVVAAGNTVKITGSIGHDLMTGGNTVSVDGDVGDDIFAGGNSVDIAVATADDIFAGGNSVSIAGETIRGDVFAGGQTVSLSGDIAGSVRVGGDTVTIKSGTTIAGDLLTWGQTEPTIEDGVTVGGRQEHTTVEGKQYGAPDARMLIAGLVSSILAWTLAGLVVLYLAPGFTRRVATTALSESGRSLGIGFLWLLAFVPAIILLFVSFLGWPLALLTMFLSGTLLMLAGVFSVVVIGIWVMRHVFKRETDVSWQHILLGAVVLKALQLIPVIGWLIGAVVMVLVLGAIVVAVWPRLRRHGESEPVADA